MDDGGAGGMPGESRRWLRHGGMLTEEFDCRAEVIVRIIVTERDLRNILAGMEVCFAMLNLSCLINHHGHIPSHSDR